MNDPEDRLSLSKDFEGACEIEISDLRVNVMLNSLINAQRQGSAKQNGSPAGQSFAGQSFTGQNNCPARKFKRQLVSILAQHNRKAWKRKKLLDEYFQAVEQQDLITEISSCGCDSCQESRMRVSRMRVSSNLDLGLYNLTRVDGSPRLFAISILIGDPFLVCRLIDRESDALYNDACFYACDDERDLKDDCGIAENTAKAVFSYKSRFFGGNIVEYMRSSSTGRLSKEKESKWLMGQMLLIAKIMADPENESERNFLGNGGIGHLTFTDHSGMDFTRTYNLTTLPWTDTLSLQSFGFLLLDMILFLDQDVKGVMTLDNLRKQQLYTDSWFKNIDASVIERLCDNSRLRLGRAFDLARALIQPQGPFGLSTETSYEYFLSELTRIWEEVSTENDTLQDQLPRGSTSNSNKESLINAQLANVQEKPAGSSNYQDEVAMDVEIGYSESVPESSTKSHRTSKGVFSMFSTSSSNAGVSKNPQPKEEPIAESNFRWRSLYYINEKNPRQKGPCWVRVLLKDRRLFFYIYPFDDIHLTACTVCDVNIEWHSGLQFVPLYAYPLEYNHGREIASRTVAHRFKVRYKNRDASRDGIHFVFSTQNREDAVQIQEAFTNQPIKMDVIIDGFSVESKKNLLLAGNSATFQIWQVMGKDELNYEFEIDKKSPRMGGSSKPRFKMALFCIDKLVILDVTSQVNLKDVRDTRLLKIWISESKPTGRVFRHKSAEEENSEGRYPGLPFFKGASPGIRKDGEEISWVSIQLTFKLQKEKEHIRRWLAAEYNATLYT